MIYAAAKPSRAVVPVSPYLYSPFQQAGSRQQTGTWTKSYPTPFEQFVRKAATGIGDFLNATHRLQLSAQELSRKTVSFFGDEKKALEQTKKLIGDYNATLLRLKDAEGYMNPLVRKSLDGAISERTYDAVGIRKNEDGTLSVDEKTFQASVSSNAEHAFRSVSRLAKNLETEASRFRDVPASSLVNPSMLALQQFAAYQSTMQSYWQLPTSGLLVNQFV